MLSLCMSWSIIAKLLPVNCLLDETAIKMRLAMQTKAEWQPSKLIDLSGARKVQILLPSMGTALVYHRGHSHLPTTPSPHLAHLLKPFV